MLRQYIINICDIFAKRQLGPFIKKSGLALDSLGVRVSGGVEYVERYVRSLRCLIYQNKIPDLKRASFVAPNAVIIGDVAVGSSSSIWYGAVLRGDQNFKIQIGEETIIQDQVVIKSDTNQCQIGNSVFVGPNVLLGSCVLQDHAFVGMGAKIEDGVTVEPYAVVAAGSYVPQDTIIPSNQIWAGNPAKFLREVTPEEKEAISETHIETMHLAQVHAEETEKTTEQVFETDIKREAWYHQTITDAIWQHMEKAGYFPHVMDRFEMHDHLGSEYTYAYKKHNIQKNIPWKAYQDSTEAYPEQWKLYKEDYQRYERAKKTFEQPTPYRQPEPDIRRIPVDQSPWTRRY